MEGAGEFEERSHDMDRMGITRAWGAKMGFYWWGAGMPMGYGMAPCGVGGKNGDALKLHLCRAGRHQCPLSPGVLRTHGERHRRLKSGDIPPALRQRVEKAEEADLNTWAERLLFADKLGAVFKEPRN